MSLTVPRKVDAYFGPEVGKAGASGTPVVSGSAAFGWCSNHVSDPEGVSDWRAMGVGGPAGTWTGSHLLDWTLSSAGLFTYTGASDGLFSIEAKSEFLPAAGTNRDFELRLALNGVDDPPADFTAHGWSQSAEDQNAFIVLLARLVLSTNDTLQLYWANHTSSNVTDIDRASVTIN